MFFFPNVLTLVRSQHKSVFCRIYNHAQVNFPEPTGKLAGALMHLHRHTTPSSFSQPGCPQGSCSPGHSYFWVRLRGSSVLVVPAQAAWHSIPFCLCRGLAAQGAACIIHPVNSDVSVPTAHAVPYRKWLWTCPVKLLKLRCNLLLKSNNWRMLLYRY